MTTALPDFVSEISGMMVTLLPVAALGAIVLAGLRLRGEGGINYDAGGSFFKWLFWGALLLTLPAIFSATIPALFSGGPAPVPPSGAGTGTFGSVATSLTTGITSFVTNILVGRIVPLMAAALCFKAILDSSEGHSPLPSIISALFVLGSQAFWTLAKTWSTSSSSTTSTVAFASADVLDSMFNYLAMTISPYVAVLCFVGAAINYQRSKPWGAVALSGLAFLSFSGLWSLVTGWMGVSITW
jgi:hypothetical protein